MPSTSDAAPGDPRFVQRDALRVAGLAARYTFATNVGIPAQWRRFQPYIGQVPGQIGETTYGVCRPVEGDAFDYICAVEVAETAEPPPELTQLRLPAQRYAVFTHEGHVSELRRTVEAIWNTVLPEAPYVVAAAPDFERYDDRFDPATGRGVVEIWIPIEDRARDADRD